VNQSGNVGLGTDSSDPLGGSEISLGVSNGMPKAYLTLTSCCEKFLVSQSRPTMLYTVSECLTHS
jgi:hypothetical protein